MNIELIITITVIIVFPLALFIAIYSYYGAYKIMKGKCKVCGNSLDNWKSKAINFMWTPWKKPKFICESCQKKKKKTV